MVASVQVTKLASAFVRRVQPTSVVEQVLGELRRSIVFGALKPGQEFSLRETATHLGVSTAPVREALRVLQGEGLIVARRARSAVVAPMDVEDLHSIYHLRRLIEPGIAARSCRLITDAQLTALDTMVDTIPRREALHRRHLRRAPRVPSRPPAAGGDGVGSARARDALASGRALRARRFRSPRPRVRRSTSDAVPHTRRSSRCSAAATSTRRVRPSRSTSRPTKKSHTKPSS